MRSEWQRRLFEGERGAGWDPTFANTFAEEIAHLHEELSEAFRAWRLNGDARETVSAKGKPEGVPAEFADVVIGMAYLAELHGFDLMAAVEAKHLYNTRRDYLAEGRQLHGM
jgi:hypothetical protein